MLELGFDERALSPDEPHDRLVDEIVAWGGVQSVADRLHAHLRAGADHVCVQVLGDGPANAVPELRSIAESML